MGSWIAEAKDKVIKIAQNIKDTYDTSQLRMSFLGYRDVRDSKRFEIYKFTSEIEELQSFIGTVRATGGGDAPEDIFGAFNEIIHSLKWESQTRVIIHIADAPCHGSK